MSDLPTSTGNIPQEETTFEADTEGAEEETPDLLWLAPNQVYGITNNDSGVRKILYQGYDSLLETYGGGMLSQTASMELRTALLLAKDLSPEQSVRIGYDPEVELPGQEGVAYSQTEQGPFVYTSGPMTLWHLECIACGASRNISDKGTGKMTVTETTKEDGRFVTEYDTSELELSAVFDRQKNEQSEILYPIEIVLRFQEEA